MVRVEESLQLTENRCSVKLERMRFTVKNFLCSVNGIGYDDDLRNNIIGTGLVDTTPDGKQFCLRAYHEWSMVCCFGERMIHYVDVRDRCSNIVFDASICYHEGVKIAEGGLNFYFSVLFFSFIFFFIFDLFSIFRTRVRVK